MPKNKKNFIDKKNSVTFRLVQRTQNDPLFVDPDAPQYVLIEKKTREQVEIDFEKPQGQQNKLSSADRKIEQAKYGVYFDDDYDYLQHLIDVDEVQRMKGVEIVSKDIVVEDNAGEGVAGPSKPKLMLPSSLFESKVEEKVDLSKRAALPVGPQLDWDPDVVEAMDDDFDFDNPDNQIDDDFVTQAMGGEGGGNDDGDNEMQQGGFDGNLARIEHDSDKDSVCGYAGSDDDNDEEYDHFPTNGKGLRDLMSKPNFRKFLGHNGEPGDFDDDDAKTYKTSASQHFTEYSMSSSVVPRSEHLKNLDERFESMFISEYGDEEMGALDGDEELENINQEDNPFQEKMLDKLVNEYQEAKEANFGVQYELNKEAAGFAKQKYANYDSNNESDGDDESSEEEFETILVNDPARKGDKDRFDCESILSTYSNTMYHPKVLRDTDRYGNVLTGKRKNHIRIDPKTGMPMVNQDVPMAPTARNLAALDDNRTVRTDMSRLTELSIRPKNETSDEKRERKSQLREFRAARRQEKKANKEAFSEENRRLHKVEMNNAQQKKVAVI